MGRERCTSLTNQKKSGLSLPPVLPGRDNREAYPDPSIHTEIENKETKEN